MQIYNLTAGVRLVPELAERRARQDEENRAKFAADAEVGLGGLGCVCAHGIVQYSCENETEEHTALL